MATHASILTWEIPQTEEPGGLQFMGSQRVEHDGEWEARVLRNDGNGFDWGRLRK